MPTKPPNALLHGTLDVLILKTWQVKGQPDEPREQPQIYVPLAQNAWWSASLVVQPDRGPAEALVSTVRAAIADVDKERPVRQMRTLQGIAWEATSRPRFRA